jgi:hypothetical protein
MPTQLGFFRDKWLEYISSRPEPVATSDVIREATVVNNNGEVAEFSDGRSINRNLMARKADHWGPKRQTVLPKEAFLWAYKPGLSVSSGDERMRDPKLESRIDDDHNRGLIITTNAVNNDVHDAQGHRLLHIPRPETKAQALALIRAAIQSAKDYDFSDDNLDAIIDYVFESLQPRTLWEKSKIN